MLLFMTVTGVRNKRINTRPTTVTLRTDNIYERVIL